MNELDEGRRAYELIAAGNFPDALKIADSLLDKNIKAAVLIDGGFEAGKSGVIRKGVQLLESLLEEPDELRDSSRLAQTYYNAANGYYSIFLLRRMRRAHVVAANNRELRSAKRYYREAVNISQGANPAFLAELYINYANCLSQLGRGIEAVPLYKRAITLDSKNPMANGNLGQELSYLGGILPTYNIEYLISAEKHLDQALKAKPSKTRLSESARKSFEQSLNWVQQTLSTIGEFDQLSISLLSRLRRFRDRKYLRFCAERDLFLNAWVGDYKDVEAITDSVRFGPITLLARDQKTVPEMLRILNDAKEAFSTARYLFFLSQSRYGYVTRLSKLTTFFNSGKQELNGLNIGLCKSAYLRAFDVLDKVARITNVYFQIGDRRTSFWKIFAQKHSAGEAKIKSFIVRPEIEKLNNQGLFALADLCIDYFESEHTDFKMIDDRRNLMTHDYLVVDAGEVETSYHDNHISESEFYEQTNNVLTLAKNSILYLIFAVSIAEKVKDSGGARLRKYEHYHGD